MFVCDDAAALAKPKTVIGLMSGTSVDAVDACCVKLSMAEGKLAWEILGTYTQAIPANIRKRLLKCMNNEPVLLKEISSLNTAVGQSFVDAAYGVMQASGLRPENIDVIGSHGQTVFHFPPPGEGIIGHTLQIGEPAVISEFTGVPVVGDFRPRDMALGGQGAPLVPFADKLLFQDESKARCVQNIGGMANVTVLPPAADASKNIIAFDTGPGNVLIDSAMDILFGKPLDENGAVAKQGKVNAALLEELMGHEYLDHPPPKSTGREEFGRPFAEALIAKHNTVSKEDMVSTLTAYTVESIANAYERFVFPHCKVDEVIVGGGGVKNPALMDGLKSRLKMLVKTHADYGVPDQYKEALAFAILGWSAMAGIPNNIPSCTGARHAAVLGKIIF